MYQVLFVEDDEDIRFLVSRYRIWRQGQFRIADTAGHGREALEKLAAVRYDLVITDIRMPVMDGLELCRQIREQGYGAVVILASTYSDFAYAKEGMRLGAVEYIEKPYSEEKLAEALNLASQFLKGGSWENELFQKLMAGEEGSECLADKLWKRMEEEYPSNPDMAREEAVAVLQGIYRQMVQRAPWLEVLEQVDICIGRDALTDTQRVLQEFSYLISRYHLRRPDPVVQRMVSMIDYNIARDRIQDYLAEQMELSKDYMGKLFRNSLGVTISDYCTRLRMEKAKSMLLGTNKKVYEIGEELGYSTVDYFTRLFKNYTGHTPASYRRHGAHPT